MKRISSHLLDKMINDLMKYLVKAKTINYENFFFVDNNPKLKQSKYINLDLFNEYKNL